MVISYWKNVANLAFKETVGLFGFAGKYGFLISVSVSASMLALLAFWQGQAAAADEAKLRIVSMIAVAIWIPVVFLSRLLCIPAKLDAQSKDDIAALYSELASKSDASGHIDTMAAIHREAVSLLNDYLGEDAAEGTARDLLNRIDAAAKNCDATDRAIIYADDWKRLDRHRWDGLVFEYDDERNPLELLALRIQAVERVFGF